MGTVTVTDSTVPVSALPLTGAGLLALLLSAATAWGRSAVPLKIDRLLPRWSAHHD